MLLFAYGLVSLRSAFCGRPSLRNDIEDAQHLSVLEQFGPVWFSLRTNTLLQEVFFSNPSLVLFGTMYTGCFVEFVRLFV